MGLKEIMIKDLIAHKHIRSFISLKYFYLEAGLINLSPVLHCLNNRHHAFPHFTERIFCAHWNLWINPSYNNAVAFH